MERMNVEFKMDDMAEGAEKGSFSGYGSTFGNGDLGGDVVEKGAFDKAIQSGKMPAMLYMHDMKELPIGNYTAMSIDDRGLKMHGRIWVDKGIPKANQAYEMFTNPGPKGLSIGFIVNDSEMDDKGIRHIKDVELLEVSPVIWPMNPKAAILDAKSWGESLVDALKSGDIRKAEGALRDAGLSRKDSKKLLAGGFASIVRDEQVEQKSEIIERLNQLQSIMKGK